MRRESTKHNTSDGSPGRLDRICAKRSSLHVHCLTRTSTQSSNRELRRMQSRMCHVTSF